MTYNFSWKCEWVLGTRFLLSLKHCGPLASWLFSFFIFFIGDSAAFDEFLRSHKCQVRRNLIKFYRHRSINLSSHYKNFFWFPNLYLNLLKDMRKSTKCLQKKMIIKNFQNRNANLATDPELFRTKYSSQVHKKVQQKNINVKNHLFLPFFIVINECM